MLLGYTSFNSTIISSARFWVSGSTVVWTVTHAGAMAINGDTRMTRRSAPLSGPATVKSDTHATATAFIIKTFLNCDVHESHANRVRRSPNADPSTRRILSGTLTEVHHER